MAKVTAIILQREVVRDRAVCNLIGVVSFVILTTIGAYVRIPLPFTPVPITLQTFFVILAGAILGARLGSITQVSYIALGATGLSIFQNYGSGMAHLAGPTGGYLLGFIVAPLVVGKLIFLKKDTTFWWVAFSMAMGSMLILFLGAVHLMNFLHIGMKEGFIVGIFYFLPGDFVKIIFAASLYLAFNKRIHKIFRLDD